MCGLEVLPVCGLSLTEQKFQILMDSCLPVWFFMEHTFIMAKQLFTKPYIPTTFSKSFVVFCSLFRSTTHFELILV